MTPWHLSLSICVHFIQNKCFHLSNSNSSRLLLTSDMMSEVRSSNHRVPKMKLLAALELTRGGENEFWLDKMYVARVLCKKMDQIAHFWPEWWFKLFTSAYRGSPPPAVFQNKYQSYKYERNTAGKSATRAPTHCPGSTT